MNITIYKSHTFLKIEAKAIHEKPFIWGGKSYPVGTEFEKIGSKKRSFLFFEVPLIYKGLLPDGESSYVLFHFKGDKPGDTYLAPIYVNENTLLMQSSFNSFWDITC